MSAIYLVAGTRRASSVAQSSTTVICVGAAACVPLNIRNRWPSAATSKLGNWFNGRSNRPSNSSLGAAALN